MVPVARRNLFAEKGRFLISVAGVAFAVLLILIVLALYRGFSRSGQTFRELPGDLWVVQQGTTDPFHSTSLIERSELEALAGIEGIAAVVPVLSRTMEFDADGKAQSARLLALDVEPALPLPDETRRRFLPPPGTFVVDKTLGRQTGLGTGDRADFGGVSLTVDHVEPASGEAFMPFVFVNYADAERIFGVGEIVSYGMVVLTDGVTADDTANEIEQSSPQLRVFTGDEFASAVRKEIDESFLPIITVLLAIGFVVGAAIVGLTIYTATIERSREFGVMKAVGGSPGYVYRIVLSQSAMLTAAGFLVGLAAAIGVARLASEATPEFVTDFRLFDIGGVLVAAALMAVVASLVPVHRINSIDPAAVFRA